MKSLYEQLKEDAQRFTSKERDDVALNAPVLELEMHDYSERCAEVFVTSMYSDEEEHREILKNDYKDTLESMIRSEMKL